MKRSIHAMLALAAVFSAAPVSAHIGYGSALYSGAGVYDPLTNTIGAGTYGAPANFTATVASNAGYITGFDPATLGNTHDIRFRYFTLSAPSLVSFTINGLANATVTGNPNPYLNGMTASTLNPAFSLYSSVAPAVAHDGYGDLATVAGYAPIAAYLATAMQFASWSPFADVNSVRGGPAAGSGGNPTGLWGVFDSDGDWTIGNNGQWTATDSSATDPAPADGIGPYLGSLGVPKIATAHYAGISGADASLASTWVDSQGNIHTIAGADGVVDNSVTWAGVLGPGLYTLAIGGANLSNYNNLYADVRSSLGGTDATATCGSTTCTNLYAADRLARNMSITGFTVTQVPVPAATWLFGSALAGLGALRRRQSV